MGRKFSVLLIVLLTREAVRSIQVTVSTKEQAVAEGRDATLTCRFDIPERQIYSVKWYKGNKQFYSYTPSSDHPYRTYHVEGVSINVSLSSPHDVTLTGITKETAGLYRCEVIGERPWFPMGSAEKYIEVYLIPENGLSISGAKDQYTVGDLVDVNCTSQPSRPVIHLTWWINNESARPSQVYSQSVRRVDSLNATSTTLRLTFRVDPENIPQLTLTCLANIGLIYHSRVTHRARILGVQSPTSEPEVAYDYTEAPNNHYDEDSGADTDGTSRVDCGFLLVFIYLFSIFVHI